MKNFARLVANCIERLSLISASFAAVTVAFIVCFVLYGVVMRYVFRSPTGASIELPDFLFLLVISLTLAYVQRLRGHLSIDIMVSHLSKRVQTVLSIAGSIVLVIYAAIIGWAGWLIAFDSLQSGARSRDMGIPMFAVQVFLPIAVFLLILQTVVEVSKDVARLRGKTDVAGSRQAGHH